MPPGKNKDKPSESLTKKTEGYGFMFNGSACSLCEGLCCRRESGYVWVKKADILRISNFLGIDPKVLMNDYLVKVGRRFSIREIKFKDEFPCIFFDMACKKCLIYQVRPNQCRTFPFWEEFMEKAGCPAPDYCPGVTILKTGINCAFNPSPVLEDGQGEGLI